MLERLDTEFMHRGITAHGIIAIPNHKRNFPRSVTIITTTRLDDVTVDGVLAEAEIDYWQHKRYQHQSMGSHIKQAITSRFAPAGVAVCDHRDPLNPDLGKVIAEGRLLKLLKQEVSV